MAGRQTGTMPHSRFQGLTETALALLIAKANDKDLLHQAGYACMCWHPCSHYACL